MEGEGQSGPAGETRLVEGSGGGKRSWIGRAVLLVPEVTRNSVPHEGAGMVGRLPAMRNWEPPVY